MNDIKYAAMTRAIIELSSPPHRSPYESFDERLRKIMAARGINGKDLAARMKYDRASFSNIRTGKFKPSFWVMCEIAKILNISLDYLCGFTDEPRPLHPEN